MFSRIVKGFKPAAPAREQMKTLGIAKQVLKAANMTETDYQAIFSTIQQLVKRPFNHEVQQWL